jgi:hypothetical protein
LYLSPVFDRGPFTEHLIRWEQRMAECVVCHEEIEGTVVWLRQFGELMQVSPNKYQFVASVSLTQDSEHHRPHHPACFTKTTGQHWPPPAFTSQSEVPQN